MNTMNASCKSVAALWLLLVTVPMNAQILQAIFADTPQQSGPITPGGTFLLSGGNPGPGANIAASTPIYMGVWTGTMMPGGGGTTTVTHVAMPVWEAGTYSLPQIYLSANDRGAASFTLQKGAYAGGACGSFSDTTISIAINSSQTGRIAETTNGGSDHTVHFAVNDCIVWKFTPGSGGTTLNVRWAAILFASDTTAHTLTKFGGAQAPNITSSGVYYQVLGGLNQGNSVRAESSVQFKFRTGGTWSHLCVNVTANTFNNASVAKSRLGGVNGAQSITIPANTTGLFCDTGAGDTVSDGTLAAWNIDVGSGSSTCTGGCSFTFTGQSSQLITTDKTGMLLVQNSGSGAATNANATSYQLPNGDPFITTTEGLYQLDMRTSMTLSNMSVHVVTNTITANTVFTLWKGNATTLNLTTTAGSGVTGWLDDNTHSDSVASGDLIEFKTVGGATGTGINVTALAIKATVP